MLKIITCIVCPLGCDLKIEIEDQKIQSVSGYECKRGKIYAEEEVTCPQRWLTSTVKVIKGRLPVLPVKTEKQIPKRCLLSCIEFLKNVTVEAPVKLGDIIVENIQGTGVNVVATRSLAAQFKESEGNE